MNLRQLVTAGAKECGRCPLQQLDVHVGMNLSSQVHILLIQKTLNAMEHSVYLVESSLLCGLVHAREAGIDYGSRSA